jgi:type 2 lantibiotic biosynthesis protein LanM
MTHLNFQSSDWHKALTLTERITSRRLVQNQTTNGKVGDKLAERHIQRWRSQKPFDGVDISGLGATAGQRWPYRLPNWQEVGTDQMRLTQEWVEMLGDQNRPSLNQAEVNVLDYTEAILTGFTEVYRLLLQYRSELLSNDGLLASFAEDEVRVILRPTRTYGMLLHESFHPDMLRNALDRDRLFDRLWLNIEQQPYLAKVISAERDDLWKSDIPLFTTCPNSRDIWSSSGEQITDFFEESGLTLVQRRLQKLSEVDLTQQQWLIRASLTTLATATVQEQTQWPSYLLREPQNQANHEQLLAGAQAIGKRLEMLALSGEKDASWIGVTLSNQQYWTLTPLGIDLYDGLPGVVLFLAYLGNLTQEQRYTALAKAALTALQHQIENGKELIKSIGGFDGWGGIIYTLTQLSALWDEPELLNQAESLVALLPPLITEDEQFDIISGAAGCIGSLINLYRCKPSPSILATAIQCGDRLIAKAQPMEQGIGWKLKNAGTQPLTGFSHGAAGIAWALLELSALTGEERFRTAALDAIAYERSLFCPEVGNWPDLRNFTDTVLKQKDKQQTCMTAWCHGAPGIGLARLCSLPHLDIDSRR